MRDIIGNSTNNIKNNMQTHIMRCGSSNGRCTITRIILKMCKINGPRGINIINNIIPNNNTINESMIIMIHYRYYFKLPDNYNSREFRGFSLAVEMGMLDVIVDFEPLQPLSWEVELIRVEPKPGLRGNELGLLQDIVVG